MRKKAPLFEGQAPDDRFSLDDESHLKLLGLNPSSLRKIADEYDHYPRCAHAVVEYKSKNIRDCITQLEATANQLTGAGKKTDVAIIVVERITRAESRFFRKDKSHKLYDKRRAAFSQIHAGNHLVDILIFYTDEVNQMWKEYSGRLDRWAYT